MRTQILITSEWSEQSSYQQSYIGRLDDNQIALRPIEKIRKD